MCGRFVLEDDGTMVAAQFGLAETTELAPRYNIAPTQPVAAIGRRSDGSLGLTHFQWGLIPSWAKEAKIGSRMINARGETAAEKPSFRAAFKRRRCLIPMSGFYEWQKRADGQKQPLYIHAESGDLLAAAGLWEHWHSPDGSEIRSCTIITTTPNELMAPIHNRMPAFLTKDNQSIWLDPNTPIPELVDLIQPLTDGVLTAYSVSTHVNRPQNDDPSCIQPFN